MASELRNKLNKLRADFTAQLNTSLAVESKKLSEVILQTEERIMNLLNVKDKVDWKIRSEQVASRQGRFKRLGDWLSANDQKIQDRLFRIEKTYGEVEQLRQQVKHYELALARKDEQFREHQGHVIRFMDIAQECQAQSEKVLGDMENTEARVARLIQDNKDQVGYFMSLKETLQSMIRSNHRKLSQQLGNLQQQINELVLEEDYDSESLTSHHLTEDGKSGRGRGAAALGDGSGGHAAAGGHSFRITFDPASEVGKALYDSQQASQRGGEEVEGPEMHLLRTEKERQIMYRHQTMGLNGINL